VPASTRTAHLGNRSAGSPGRGAVSPNQMPVHTHTRHAGTYLWGLSNVSSVLRHLAKSQTLTRGAGLKADWAVRRASWGETMYAYGLECVSLASPDCAVRVTLVLSFHYSFILFFSSRMPTGLLDFPVGLWLTTYVRLQTCAALRLNTQRVDADCELWRFLFLRASVLQIRRQTIDGCCTAVAL
jgi:hypothetical protein